MTATTASYTLCDSCAAATVNADFTGLDTTEAGSLTSLLERTGYIVHIRASSHTGYWICDGCGYDAIGAGHIFHPLD